jgi:hypothetical protein
MKICFSHGILHKSARYPVILIVTHLLLLFSVDLNSQKHSVLPLIPGYEKRINDFIDSLRVFDTHEHLLNPAMLKDASSFDFTLLFLENSKNDLISAGMPDSLFVSIFNSSVSPEDKWDKIEPYWNKSLNTTSNRVILLAINDLYNINELSRNSVGLLTQKMQSSYQKELFDHLFRDICKIDFIIQDGVPIKTKGNYIKNITRFSTWISIDSKRIIDSLAIMQIEPIYKLEGLVENLKKAFKAALDEGMVAIKIDMAYTRSLSFENVTQDAARKVFKILVNGNSDTKIPTAEAKPLQDYLVHQLLSLAQQYKIPVAFHTGLQAGHLRYIENSNPVLLSNLFVEYPNVNFVLFHGSYPYGGELSALARNFRNVFIDMNWTYSISPTYAERYMSEWLETVPANKIMAFGGDQRTVENSYGNLVLAKSILSNVLVKKVEDNLLSESEAKNIARMLLHDNGMNFYNIH